MRDLQLCLQQLGLGGGVLFGVPLVILGLALRGLARQQALRLTKALAALRPIADIHAVGSIGVVGRARPHDADHFLLEDSLGSARVVVRHDGHPIVRDGEPLFLYGAATQQIMLPGTYRDDARAWLVDARGEDALVLLGGAVLPARLRRARLQAISGALFFTCGFFVFAASASIAIFSPGS